MTRKKRIPRLGLTGGIGSGKSTACAFLRELGAVSVSADDIVHELLADESVVAQIGEHLGGDFVVDGSVERGALAQVVFADDKALEWLEGLIHPLVRQRIEEWAAMQDRLAQRPPLLVAEIPLLFESGLDREFDYVMLVTAPEAVRRKRVAAKLTGSEFARRAKHQLEEGIKASRSDFIYDNRSSRGDLKQFVSESYARILAGRSGGQKATRRPR